jgi:hypothetical protein
MAKPKISPPDQYATDGTRKGNPGSQKRREIKELITCHTRSYHQTFKNCSYGVNIKTKWGIHSGCSIVNLPLIRD